MTKHEKRKMYYKTVRTHRKYVFYWCRKMGIFWQGVVHDLSKYSKRERNIYLYYGTGQSPHEIARQELGYSPSWLFHKNHNKHHWEFWLDNEDIDFTPVKIPYKYVIEMFCDMVGANKTYAGKVWDCSMPLQYFRDKCEGKRLMHNKSQALLVRLFYALNDNGEKKFLQWYKKNKGILKERYERIE